MDATFRELAADDRVESVALSHLSIELGHLYMEDFNAGPERLRAHFEGVAPWAHAARQIASVESRKARVSTCFLIDDYFTRFSSPAAVLPDVLAAARASGLEIDYVARESGCARANGVVIAELLAGRLTALPAPGTNGSRPPALETGWLCNGQRSPGGEDLREAMRRPTWAPPMEIGATNHSVFVDVELWSEKDGPRIWSCAYLAAVWQLLRLGILRNAGASIVHPAPLPDELPGNWDELPPVVRVNPAADAFCAYRTLSVLPARFLHIEHAVRVILEQVAPLPAVIDQIVERGEREGLRLPVDLTERINYIFFSGG